MVGNGTATFIPAHRAFWDLLTHEAAMVARYGTPLTLVLLRGETVPAQRTGRGRARVRARLLETFRRVDWVAPFPPAGHAVLLPQTDVSGARRAVQKLRALRSEEGSRGVGAVCAAIAAYRPGEAPAAFVSRCEAALQRAEPAHPARWLRVARAGARRSPREATLTSEVLPCALNHEIKQPLAAVTAYAQAGLHRVAQGAIEPEAMNALLLHLLAQARRAAEIADYFALLARGTCPQRAAIPVARLLETPLQLIAAEAEERAVAVEVRLAQGLPEIAVSRVQIEQVLLNLLRNAVEAAGDGPREPPRVRVVGAAARDGLCLSVCDNGAGLPAGMRERLFQPFATTKLGGTGLGLALSRRVAELHGGTLRASRTRTGETCFHLLLPYPDPLGEGGRPRE